MLPTPIFHTIPTIPNPVFHNIPSPAFPTIPFLLPFFVPFLPPFFIPLLPPFFNYQPGFLLQYVNVARPCPQWKNLDNSAYFMNLRLLVVLRQVAINSLFKFIAYSIHILKM